MAKVSTDSYNITESLALQDGNLTVGSSHTWYNLFTANANETLNYSIIAPNIINWANVTLLNWSNVVASAWNNSSKTGEFNVSSWNNIKIDVYANNYGWSYYFYWNIYRILNTISSKSTNMKKWIPLNLKEIWEKANTNIFGMLSNGTRRNWE